MKKFFKDVYDVMKFGVIMFSVIFLASVVLSFPITIGLLITHHF